MESTVLLVQKFGKYEIGEKLGEGVFGSTYLGYDPLLDRQVAIKAYHEALTASPDFFEHFRQEARQLASLHHPNIVTVIDAGEENGQFYLVTEFLPGGSLAQTLEGNQPLPILKMIEILRPVAEALDYAHSRQVCHRDLKPANILFAEDGHPVLTDFAVAKPAPHGSNGSLLRVPVVGTPEYLAPEQILNKDASPQSDVYALGIIAFQMLAARPPFVGSAEDIYLNHLEQVAPDVCQYNPAIPKEFSDVFLRALSVEPDKRFGTTTDLINTLEQISVRISREQGRTLYQGAKEHMRLLQFDAAIAKLEQVLTLRSNAEIENLLKECQRRKQLLEEIQLLKAQISQAQSRLDTLMAAETWLKSAPPPNQNASFLQRVTGRR